MEVGSRQGGIGGLFLLLMSRMNPPSNHPPPPRPVHQVVLELFEHTEPEVRRAGHRCPGLLKPQNDCHPHAPPPLHCLCPFAVQQGARTFLDMLRKELAPGGKDEGGDDAGARGPEGGGGALLGGAAFDCILPTLLMAVGGVPEDAEEIASE